MQHTTTQWIKTSDTVLRKIYTSHFIVKVCVWEGVGDRTELQYTDPHFYDHQCCVFLVLQGCSTGGLRAQLSAECCSHYRILSLTHLISNSIGGPKGPFCWLVSFPTTSCLQLVWSPNHWFPVLPSYIIVQTPTQYLFSWLARPEYATSGVFRLACLIIIKRK